jgi:hypothetical protein
MTGDDHLDLDGYGPALDPVDNWRLLDDGALADALTARGVDDTVADRLAHDRHVDEFPARLLDRYFSTGEP